MSTLFTLNSGSPYRIALDSDEVAYVTSLRSLNSVGYIVKINLFNPAITETTLATRPNGKHGMGKSLLIFGVAFNKNGTLLVCIEADKSIIYYTKDGSLLPKNNTLPNNPSDLVIAPDGIVYVSSIPNNAIYRIFTNNSFSLFAGGIAPGNSDGERLSARFRGPRG
jgi:hypothetical protein